MANAIIEQPLLWDGTPFATPCDGERNVESRPAVLPMGQTATLRLTFLDRATFAPVTPDGSEDASTWRFELRDKPGSGFVVLFATDSVTIDAAAHNAAIDCSASYTEELLAALGERAVGTFFAMLSGFNADESRVFTACFPLCVANTTDSEGTPEEADSLTKQVKALDGRVTELEEHQQDVDDVLFFDTKENPAAGQTAFPLYGEDGKIYGAKDTGRLYRWDADGEDYVQVGGGDAPVESVNGKTGSVVLSASDVGASNQTALATAFTAKAYAVGDFATYNGLLYRCKSAYTATAQSTKPDSDTTHWDPVVVVTLIGGKLDTRSGVGNGVLSWDGAGSLVLSDGYFQVVSSSGATSYCDGDVWSNSGDHQHVWQNSTGTIAHLENLASVFDDSDSYIVGQLVVYDGVLYRCTAEHTGAWNASHFTQATVEDVLALLRTAIAAKYTKPSGGIPASDLAAGVIPTVPVTSVNTKTGAVVLSASDIGDGQGGTVLGGLQHLDSTKQDAISDLATIRSGAAAGATAVQPSGLANYVQKSQTAGLLKNDGTVDTNTYLTTAPVTSVNGQTGAVTLAIPDISGKLDATKRNLLDYTSSTTLALGTAVYQSSLASDGTFPTVDATGIPPAAAYYQFELELAVPSAIPSTITGPSGWVWLDGHGLPDPADLSGGETIYVSVRLDCTARAFLASVWRVA